MLKLELVGRLACVGYVRVDLFVTQQSPLNESGANEVPRFNDDFKKNYLLYQFTEAFC